LDGLFAAFVIVAIAAAVVVAKSQDVKFLASSSLIYFTP
jgi:uncharacterized protein involved in exopolysaccharide biosynthesis